jgi:predicted dehydrogenase
MRPGRDYRELYAAHKKQGGGVILDVIHEIDYMCWLFGAGRSVLAHSAKLSELDIDVEDFASIVIEPETGVRSVLTMDYLQQCKRRGCEIIGTEGTLVWETVGKQPESCLVKLYRKEVAKWELLLDMHDVNGAETYMRQVKGFVSEIQGKDSCLARASEGVNALEVALGAHLSSETGRVVIFD